MYFNIYYSLLCAVNKLWFLKSLASSQLSYLWHSVFWIAIYFYTTFLTKLFIFVWGGFFILLGFLSHILWLCQLSLNRLTWAFVILGSIELFSSFSRTGLGHIPDKCELVCYFYWLCIGQTQDGKDSRENKKHLWQVTSAIPVHICLAIQKLNWLSVLLFLRIYTLFHANVVSLRILKCLLQLK